MTGIAGDQRMTNLSFSWGCRQTWATALLTYSYLVATSEAFYRGVRRETNGTSARDYKQGIADRIKVRVWDHKRCAWNHPGICDLIRVGTEVARNAMKIERLFCGSGFATDQGARDGEAYQRGYADGGGPRVDLHSAHTSRMLKQG
jgi:hypothetical protein